MSKISDNLNVKTLSIFLALFVWFIAKQGEGQTQISLFAPVVIKNLPGNLQITSDIPSQVNILASMTLRQSQNFNPAGIQAVVDLNSIKSGDPVYILTKKNIKIPQDIDVLKISPSQIKLQIEEVIEKEFQLQPRYEGKLKKGYVLNKIDISPKTVTFSGPKKILTKIKTIYTKKIILDDKSSSIDQIARVDIPNEKLLIKDNVTYIAHISIASVPVKELFNKVPIYQSNSTYKTIINPKFFKLHLEGPADIISELDPAQLYGIIDLAYKRPGNYRVHPTPIVPKGVKVIEQWPIISMWVTRDKLVVTENVLKRSRK